MASSSNPSISRLLPATYTPIPSARTRCTRCSPCRLLSRSCPSSARPTSPPPLLPRAWVWYALVLADSAPISLVCAGDLGRPRADCAERAENACGGRWGAARYARAAARRRRRCGCGLVCRRVVWAGAAAPRTMLVAHTNTSFVPPVHPPARACVGRVDTPYAPPPRAAPSADVRIYLRLQQASGHARTAAHPSSLSLTATHLTPNPLPRPKPHIQPTKFQKHLCTRAACPASVLFCVPVQVHQPAPTPAAPTAVRPLARAPICHTPQRGTARPCPCHISYVRCGPIHVSPSLIFPLLVPLCVQSRPYALRSAARPYLCHIC